MKNYFVKSLMLATVTMFAACEPEQGEEALLTTDAPDEIVYNADGTGGQSVITVSTNQPAWDFSLTPADGNGWLSAEKGENAITMKAEKNESIQSRDAVVMTITAGTAKPVRIHFGQLAAGLRFDLVPDITNVSFELDGRYVNGEEICETADFKVETNIGDWSVVLEPEDGNGWLEVSGRDAAGFSIMAQPIDDMAERAAVKVIVTAGEFKKEITATQKKGSVMNLEGLSDGKLTVTFADGTFSEASVKDGVALYGVEEGTPRLIYSIKHELAEKEVYIGRKDNELISLKFAADTLTFRDPVDGIVPLGTYSEIQLIRNSEEARSWSFVQEADLDLLGGDDVEAAGLERRNWNTLGADTYHAFGGTFDGCGHEIHNIYACYDQDDNTSMYISFIGFVKKGTVKSVKIMSGKFNGQAWIAGIAGVLDNAKVMDCYNAAEIKGLRCVGGICGTIDYQSSVSDCINDGSVTGLYEGAMGYAQTDKIGGIVGYSTLNSPIKNCVNNGDVERKSVVKGGLANVGGIAGLCQYSVENCVNNGNVTADGTMVGGIAGEFQCITNGEENKIFVRNCRNTGDVEGQGSVGGLCGVVFLGHMVYSVNEGDVTATEYNCAGGIAGMSFTYTNGFAPSKYDGCYNLGDVSGKGSVGGFIGNGGNFIVNSCYSIGSITGDEGTTGSFLGTFAKDHRNMTDTEVKGCYFLQHSELPAIGSNLNEVTEPEIFAFGKFSWPDSGMDGWKIGNGENSAYWKSLGAWKDGGTPDGINSTFPTLYWEK